MMGSTLLQAEKLADLQESGVEVYLTSGATGSSGIQHSKTLLVDDYLIVGSTNWTTSSKQNEEMSVLVQLNPDGFEQFDKRLSRLKQRSSNFTRERAVKARDARAARQELRSSSVPDVYRTAKRFSIARAKSRDALKLA
jgi:phosphatidylserine/phosphatidylglycerophosphate/cardiolipin synthase-like enzyme